MEHVWVLDFNAENEDTGDYMGWRTVHATKESAVQLMFARFDELGVDYDSPALEVTASSEADDGSECKDFTASQWGWERISYGVQRTEVLA